MLNQVSQRVRLCVRAVRNVFKKKSCGASPVNGEIVIKMGKFGFYITHPGEDQYLLPY